MVLLIPRAVPCMLLGSTHGVDDASEIELDVMAATEQVAEDSASQLTWAAHDFHLQGTFPLRLCLWLLMCRLHISDRNGLRNLNNFCGF